MAVPEKLKMPFYLITAGAILVAIPLLSQAIMTTRHQDRLLEWHKSSTSSNPYIPDQMRTAWGDRTAFDIAFCLQIATLGVGCSLVVFGMWLWRKQRSANPELLAQPNVAETPTQPYVS